MNTFAIKKNIRDKPHVTQMRKKAVMGGPFCIVLDNEGPFKTLHDHLHLGFWLTYYIHHFRRKRVS